MPALVEGEMAQTESTPVVYGPVGIGGWLLLPLLHLLINIAINGKDVAEMFAGGSDGAELVRGSHEFVASLYNHTTSVQQWVIFGIVAVTACVMVYPVFCLVQFLRKKESVPRLMIAFYLLLLVVVGINAAFAHFFPDAAAQAGPDTTVRDVVRTVIAAAIWIPYFLTSERVGNTFVR
jgi:hypothetical protein